jgi:triphosphoribosyl-dephospho-CoA synthase
MTPPDPGSDPRAAFLLACRLDVEVAKPGNVSLRSAGHRMVAQQFIDSAHAAADALFEPGTRVGTRILNAVARTRDAAGCNTNLGIVLLVAPLAAALERLPSAPRPDAWRGALEQVLAALDVDDAASAYRAIALANPGGLGEVEQQSVHGAPSIGLRAAMALAADRDLIARQYVNAYRDLFEIGVTALQDPRASHHAVTLQVFLAFLARYPDSHIVRKHGASVAQSVTHQAAAVLRRLQHGGNTRMRANDGSAGASLVEHWDRRLKARGINPGTSADLTVAALFVAACLDPQRWLQDASGASAVRCCEIDWHEKC